MWGLFRNRAVPICRKGFSRHETACGDFVLADGNNLADLPAQWCGGIGPMGIPSSISHAKKVICVGGGLGVAPVYPQARAFKEAGAYVIGVLGSQPNA